MRRSQSFTDRLSRPLLAARDGMNRLPLRLRVLILLFCAIVPAIAAQLLAAYDEFRAAIHEREERIALVARSAASRYEQFLSGTERLMALLAAQPGAAFADPAQCAMRLAAIHNVFQERYSSLFVLDNKGTVVCASRANLIGASFADRGYFLDAIGLRRFVIGQMLDAGRATGQPVLTLAYPIASANGQVAGVLAVGVRLDYLGTLADLAADEPRWVMALVDREGGAWTRHPAARRLVPAAAVLKSAVAAARDGFVHVFDDGQSYSYRTKSLAGPAGLHLVLGAPTETLEQHFIAKFGYKFGLVFGFCVLVLGCMYVATQQYMLTPLRQLQAAIVTYKPGVRIAYHAASGAPPEFIRIGDAFTALADAVATLHEKQDALLKQRELLIREIHHRIKNNLQLISSLLALQARRIADSTAKSQLVAAQSRIHVLGAVHRQLYEQDPSAMVDVGHLIESIATQVHATTAPRDRVRLACEAVPLELPSETAVSLCLIVNEALTNAYKHAFPDGRQGTVTVRLARAGEPGWMRLTVGDDGIGLPAIANADSEPGFGSMLLRAMVGQVDGKLDLTSGHGTAVIVDFPLPPEARQDEAAVSTAPLDPMLSTANPLAVAVAGRPASAAAPGRRYAALSDVPGA